MDAPIVEGGPSLATSQGMLERESCLPDTARLRTAHLLPTAVLLTAAFFEVGLWLAGYPGWRIAVAGVLLATMVAHTHPGARFALVRVGPSSGALPLSTATHILIVALTGGLRSPFLVTMIGFSSVLLSHGWSRASKAALAMVVAGALAMALLPHAWFGPQVSEPAFSLLTALALVAVAILNTGVFVTLTRELNAAHGEVDRAREQMAAAALARARELEQMSAKLSHELKNPLGAIKALVQLSAREVTGDKPRERLQVAEAEIERMSGILKEYLSFSRPLEKLRREPLFLGRLADEVMLILSPQAASAGVALRRLGDAFVEADPRRLKEALFNLLVNALEATPRGGSVQLEIGERDGAVRLSVKDSGRGMPGDVLERIGTPFFTTREQGTGLGVALARAIFVQHGGKLEYVSVEGEGTTALGTLPVPRERRLDGAPAAG